MTKISAATIAAAALLSATLGVFVSDANAASTRICRQLQAELSGQGGSARPSAKARKYDAAIATQREQIQLARQRSRGAKCGFSLFGSRVSECGALNAKIARMEDNLDGLQRVRAKLSDESGRSRGSIMADLDANGCNDREARRAEPLKDDALVEQVFGGQPPEPALPTEGQREALRTATLTRPETDETGYLVPDENGHIRIDPPRAEYRTACVRTCDGYIFPMSSTAASTDLGRDQQACEASCPGTDVQVYYSTLGAEDPASMVSARSGALYSELPTANLFKQAGTPRPAGCGCNRPAGMEALGGLSPAEPVESGSIVTVPAPAPVAKPAQAQPAAEAAEVVSEPVEADPDKKVRVVGPTFLPDPSAAIDLQAPGRKTVR